MLARDDGIGARPRQAAALGKLSEQRRAVFRPDDAVGGQPGELVEQLAWIGVDDVEVRRRAEREPGGADRASRSSRACGQTTRISPTHPI